MMPLFSPILTGQTMCKRTPKEFADSCVLMREIKAVTALAQDIAANDETPINEETVAAYVHALRKIFVVEDMHACVESQSAVKSCYSLV